MRLLVQAAHALDLTVVAEGVEDALQLERLRELGCHQVQGFLFARPAPADRIGAPSPVTTSTGLRSTSAG